MNELRIFSNSEFSEVRTIVIDGEPWFVAVDIATNLGYKNGSRDVNNHVEPEDLRKYDIYDGNQIRNVLIINESGMYAMIFGSKLPDARKFKHWVTSEVLPAIRKAGSYSIKKPDSYTIEDPAARARRWAEEYEEKKVLEEQNKVLSAENKENRSKAYIYDKLMDSSHLVNFRDAAKEIGISQSQLTGWLKENGYVYANSAGELRPVERYMSSGLFQMKPYQNPHNGWCGNRTYLTANGLATFKMLLDTSDMNRGNMPKHGGRRRTRRNGEQGGF